MEDAVLDSIREHINTLPARQRAMMGMVNAGLSNKQIVAALNLSQITVKILRRQVMEKMHASPLADLVKICEPLKEPSWTVDARRLGYTKS